MLYSSRDEKSEMGLTRVTSRCWQGLFFLDAPGENLGTWLFQLPEPILDSRLFLPLTKVSHVFTSNHSDTGILHPSSTFRGLVIRVGQLRESFLSLNQLISNLNSICTLINSPFAM